MGIEVKYSVDASPEEIEKELFILGNLIAQEMRKLALSMGLKGTGDYAQGFIVSLSKDGKIVIENRVKYADYLEYGTFAYWDQFGLDSFPKVPDPKKKDLPAKLRLSFPKGGQPFAVMRRVLYNKELMSKLIQKVFK